MKTGTSKHPVEDTMLKHFNTIIKSRFLMINDDFHNLSRKGKRLLVVGAGLVMASICSFVLLQSIFSQPTVELKRDNIALPKDIFQSVEPPRLSPMGKLKGIIDKESVSFDVAVDVQGQIYISLTSSSPPGFHGVRKWQPISPQQWQEFKSILQFFPAVNE